MRSHHPASTVIKATDRTPGAPPAAFNLDDVADRARQYLERVRGDAAQLIVEAEAQAAEIRQQAERQGKADAMMEIEQIVAQRVAEQMQAALPVVRAVVEEIQQAQLACRTEWEQRLVHLAAAMAARVIRRELRASPEITLGLVREAIQLATGSPQLRIELNPADHAALAGKVAAIVAECTPAGTAEVVAARHITLGGCRVETRFGSIDQQIETQLARLEEELS